jgi:hypothetical protein
MEEEKTDIEIFYNSKVHKIVFNWRITEKRKGDNIDKLRGEIDE